MNFSQPVPVGAVTTAIIWKLQLKLIQQQTRIVDNNKTNTNKNAYEQKKPPVL